VQITAPANLANPRFPAKFLPVLHLRARPDFCRFRHGRKCADKVFNHIRNCMKICNLTFKKFGRKCLIFLQDSIAVSEKITTFATR